MMPLGFCSSCFVWHASRAAGVVALPMLPPVIALGVGKSPGAWRSAASPVLCGQDDLSDGVGAQPQASSDPVRSDPLLVVQQREPLL